MNQSLHDDTVFHLDVVIGSLHEAKDNLFAKEKFLRFVNTLMLHHDSWYQAVKYAESKQANGDCLWEWVKTLDNNTQSLILSHIEKESKTKENPQ